MKSLLISVRSDLAEKEVSGEKPWEMRKSAPKIVPDYLIIYAKKPKGMVIGYAAVHRIEWFYWFRMENIRNVRVQSLGFIPLEEFLGRVCISEKELADYFNNEKTIKGYQFVLRDPIGIEPVRLPFHPPQQWRYFDGHPQEIIEGWQRSSTLEKVSISSAPYIAGVAHTNWQSEEKRC